MPSIALLGTLDTKLEEHLKLYDLLKSAGADEVLLIDAGRLDTQHTAIKVTHADLIKQGEEAGIAKEKPDFDSAPRGDIVSYMTRCAEISVKKLHADGRVHGIIAAGGSGGTSIATSVMRALPIGFPKVMISTVASGDVSPFVGEVDIFMVYSVVDIAGWNGMLETVFTNAAGAMVGMARASQQRSQQQPQTTESRKNRRVGITMFGLTTPCVDMIRRSLTRDGSEVYVFHATGHGGKAMERLIEAGELDAVVDLTTTEICDYSMGGNMSAGPNRLEAGLKAGIPYVISVGACDMVNFGAKETVPEQYRERNLYYHNLAVTIMRTTKDECNKIGKFIREKVVQFAKAPNMVKIVLPGDGLSLISTVGQPFHNPEADAALYDAVAEIKNARPDVEVIRRPEAINTEAFAGAVVDALNSIPTA